MIRGRHFYHWFRDIMDIEGVSTRFPEHHQQTLVIARIIRELWPERVSEICSMCETNKRLAEMTASHLNQIDRQ